MFEVNSGTVTFLGKDVTNETINDILGLDYDPEEDYDMTRCFFYTTNNQ